MDMLIRILGNTWTLVAVWVLGPVILYVLHRRNKAKEQEATRAPMKTAPSSAPATADGENTRSGKTRPGVPMPGEEPVTGYEIKEIPSGFRGLKWGEAPVEGMNVVHDEGNDKLMARASDELKIENVPINSVLYSFNLDRLQGVMIDMPILSADPLFKILQSQWGQPKQPNPRQPKFYWLSRLQGMEATQAVFEKNHIAQKASLILSSKAIQEEKAKTRA